MGEVRFVWVWVWVFGFEVDEEEVLLVLRNDFLEYLITWWIMGIADRGSRIKEDRGKKGRQDVDVQRES